MKFFIKIKARIIANYIIKQIQKISKTDTLNEYLHVTEKINKTKYIYVKFNVINSAKDITHMNFIEFYNSRIDICKKRLPKKLYKYLNLLSKRYDFDKPEKVRKLALMVMDNISNSNYELSDGSIVHNTMFNTYITCYKITLNLI